MLERLSKRARSKFADDVTNWTFFCFSNLPANYIGSFSVLVEILKAKGSSPTFKVLGSILTKPFDVLDRPVYQKKPGASSTLAQYSTGSVLTDSQDKDDMELIDLLNEFGECQIRVKEGY